MGGNSSSRASTPEPEPIIEVKTYPTPSATVPASILNDNTYTSYGNVEFRSSIDNNLCIHKVGTPGNYEDYDNIKLHWYSSFNHNNSKCIIEYSNFDKIFNVYQIADGNKYGWYISNTPSFRQSNPYLMYHLSSCTPNKNEQFKFNWLNNDIFEINTILNDFKYITGDLKQNSVIRTNKNNINPLRFKLYSYDLKRFLTKSDFENNNNSNKSITFYQNIFSNYDFNDIDTTNNSNSTTKYKPKKLQTAEEIAKTQTMYKTYDDKHMGLDGIEVLSTGKCDIPYLTKYIFNKDSNISDLIKDFKLNTNTLNLSKPSKEQLAKKFYEFVDKTGSNKNNYINYSFKEKTENDLIKPVNVKINFNTNNNKYIDFDYIDTITNKRSNYKILNNIINTNTDYLFIDTTNSNNSTFQSLYSLNSADRASTKAATFDKQKDIDFAQSIGLYQLHNQDLKNDNPMIKYTDFRSTFNKYVKSILDKTFNPIDTNNSSENSSRNECYYYFKSLFCSDVDKNNLIKNNKLKSLPVSSLLLPNIISNFKSDLYSYVPHVNKDIYFNNFSDKSKFTTEKTNFRYIPEYYISEYLKNESLTEDDLNVWKYPFIDFEINENGILKPNPENHNLISIKKSKFIENNFKENELVYYDKSYNYSSGNDKLSSEILLNESKIKEEKINYNNYEFGEAKVEFAGSITYNHNHRGKSCWDHCGGNKLKKACWHTIDDNGGQSYTSNIYNFKYNGRIIYNICGNGDLWGEGEKKNNKFEWYGENLEAWSYNNVSNETKNHVRPEIKHSYDESLKRSGCGNGTYSYYKGRRFDDPKTILENIKKLNLNWLNPRALNCTPSSIDELNKMLQNACLYSNSPKSGKIYIGNGFNNDEQLINKIKNTTAYISNSKNDKWISATFAKTQHNVYVYDDRFYYILYRYFNENFKILSDILEAEILTHIYNNPELLLVYRIQKGYMNYAINKLQDVNPEFKLSVVGMSNGDDKSEVIQNNISCFMNVENPLMGAMIHADNLNLVDYNDYISNSIDISNLVKTKIETNDNTNIIILDSSKIPETKKYNIDSIYQNAFRMFGNISGNKLSLPGIFISDSADPIDFIEGNEKGIKIVEVDEKNKQETLNNLCAKNPGSLIVFNFKSIGDISNGDYSDNKQLNQAIKDANGETLNMNLCLPYVSLVMDKKMSELNKHQLTGIINLIFEYSTFCNEGNKNIIEIMYYNQNTIKINEGHTGLSHSFTKLNNCFKFYKHWAGAYENSNPMGRLVTNYNLV